jgi:hypothetical protein
LVLSSQIIDCVIDDLLSVPRGWDMQVGNKYPTITRSFLQYKFRNLSSIGLKAAPCS